MGPEELKEWKARLQQSHNEWATAGLLPDLRNGTSKNFEMVQYLDGYRGDFPASLSGGTESADQMVGNIMFSIINTMVAQISARHPDPIVRPIGGPAADGGARRRAWLNEQVIQTILRERKYKREADMALLSAILTPFGIVRHGFTPEVEFEDDAGRIIARHKNQTPDLPWVQFLRPWQFRIDPMVNDFAPDGEPRWVAFHNLYFASQIRKNPNLIFREDLTPTHFQDLRPLEERKKTEGKPAPKDDGNVMPMYEEWVIYDAEERKFFGISPGSEKLIREESDWPFEWGQLPYSYLAFNRQLDSPFPIPFPRMFWNEQSMYNDVWTVIRAIVKRIRRVIFVNNNSLEDGQADILTNPRHFAEFVLTKSSPKDAAQEVGFGVIDGNLLGLLFQLKEQIREVLGVSSFDRAQRANVETAAEANQIGAGSLIAKSRTQEKFEAFWSNVIRVSHRTFLQSEDAREMVLPIIGKENLNFLTEDERAQGFTTVSLEDLQGEFEYRVKLDSTLRQDPAVELSTLAAGFNLLGGIRADPQLVNQRFYAERIAELSGADPQQAILSEKLGQAVAELDAQQGEESEDPTGLATAGQQALPPAGLSALQGGG